ncbi:MAG: hypothetical protein AB7D05_08180 [Mangrovibacterium sp.]
MKRFLILAGLFLLFIQAFAQKGGPRDFDKYKSMKVSFMTEKLELSPQEAQNFWPLYNEFDKKRFELHQERRNLEKRIKENYNSYSEKKFEQISDSIIAHYRKDYELMQEYHVKFRKVLPAKKVVMINPVEDEFRFMMIREFRDKKREEKH